MNWISPHLAFDECSSGMKRKVHWDDEENGESEMEPFEEVSETDVSDDEQNNDEEPRIKDVLENLSQSVSRKRASDLLHSMATSKDILFWAPRGQLLRKNRLIPVTNIAELVEYVLLPHNDEVIKPRALNTFLDGLAELGVDKRLIKNKKILSDLLEKEKVYRENGEGEGDDDSDRSEGSDSSDGEESQSESNDGESDNESDQEGIIIEKESSKPCPYCQSWNLSATAIVKCPRCFFFLHHNNSICCYDIPVDDEHIKQAFARCNDCGATCHKNMKTSKVSLYFPSED